LKLITWAFPYGGKFNKTSGKVVLDRAAKTGTVDITIDASSIDFGHEKMNEHAKSKTFSTSLNSRLRPTKVLRSNLKATHQ
jgi:polyisoprenoid-binding protein YceI